MGMTPDWAFQFLWFSAGIGGTGAVWYFLSQRAYHSALWIGFATVVIVCFTVALHIRNDLLKRESTVGARLPDSPVRASFPGNAGSASSAVRTPASESSPSVQEQLPLAADAETAAAHYRRTSPTLKREEIRKAYQEYCDRIAGRFGLPSWAPVNQLTRMVTTNMGDLEAFNHAESEIPSAAWVAIRVLVAFETPKERPMYMSYVFIGRAPSGDEVVALFDASKQWKVLSTSRDPSANHENLMVNTIKAELQRLSDRIAPDIRRLG